MRVRPNPVPPAGLRPGVRVLVRVPATSANLGPGFDAFGLALALYDEIDLQAGSGSAGPLVEVEGQQSDALPRDASHLVLQAVAAGLAAAGVPADEIRSAGLDLRCRNRIPHGRGLGSSAAAVVAGLLAARGLLTEPGRLDDDTVLGLATRFEGHPDNAAAALLGGFTISWPADLAPGQPTSAGPASTARAVRLEVHPSVSAVICIPAGELATAKARKMLPAEVSHADAAFNAGRSGLLVEALSRRPDLLLEATADRLHQSQRAPAMPQTLALLQRIRAAGGAAVVSGAGPSVLVLGPAATVGPLVASVLALTTERQTWRVLPIEISTLGAQVTTEGVRH